MPKILFFLNRHRFVLLMLQLISLTLFCFFPCINNDFINYDDNVYITDNSLIKEISSENIKKIFDFTNHDEYKKNQLVKSVYVPLTIISFSIDYHFFKLNASSYHMTNLIFHLCNCLLVFILFFMISKKEMIAFLTALFFAIHPLHVEPVAWVSGRKDMLYSFFFLITLIFYLLYTGKKSLLFYALSLLFFALSSLAKPMAVSLPLLLFLMDYIKERKLSKNLFFEKIPFFLLSLCIIIISFIIISISRETGTGYNEYYIYSLSWLKIISISFYGFFAYFAKTLLPLHLSCLYPYPETAEKNFPPVMLLSPLIFAYFSTLVFIFSYFNRKLAFGFLFFIITLMPVFFRFPPQFIADRNVYIPLLGLFYLLSELISICFFIINNKSTNLKVISALFFILLIFILGFSTWKRCHTWKNSITVWTDVINQYPYIYIAYNNRGNAYFKKGDFNNALNDYNIAIGINPNQSEIHNKRGYCHFRSGNLSDALKDYNKAIDLSADCAEIYNNRGILYMSSNEPKRALSDFNHALKLKPDLVNARLNINILVELKKQSNHN